MLRQKLIEKIKAVDGAFRRAFRSAQVRQTISSQIKALRSAEGRNWTQKELGDRAGMKQNAIARLENSNYDGYSVRTLLRLADAFDVGLIVRFASFSELVRSNQTANLERLSPASVYRDFALNITQVSPTRYDEDGFIPRAEDGTIKQFLPQYEFRKKTA